MKIDFTDCYKKQLTFWDKLTSDEKNMLYENSQTRHFDKGVNIHSCNGNCLGVMLIKSGTMRVYMLSEEGREITLYRLSANDICILSASCVIKAITFDVFIDAEEDCEVLQISASAFRKLSEQNIYVEAFAYKLATERFSDVMWAMQQVLFMSFDKRLAVFLLDESAKSGNIIKLTHEQIAKYTGSAREVVTRMLKYFAEEKMVKLSRGAVEIIDKEKMRKLIK